MLLGQFAKVLRTRPRHGLGAFLHLLLRAVIGQRLSQHHQVRLLLRGLGDQRCVLRRFVGGVLAILGQQMNRGQPDLARGRGGHGGQRHIAPFHARVGCPLQVELDLGLPRLHWRAQRALAVRPLAGIDLSHLRIFRLGTRHGAFGVALLGRLLPGHGFAILILPQDARIHAAALHWHGAGFLPGAELVVLAAFHRQRARPAADPLLACSRFQHERAFALVPAFRVHISGRLGLLSR